MATRDIDLPPRKIIKRKTKIIPISAAAAMPEVVSDDYKVMVISDLHMNRAYKNDPTERNGNGHYTYFGNGMAVGFFKSLKNVDELVLAGDTFDFDKLNHDSEPLPFADGPWNKAPNESVENRLKHRHDPEAFLKQIMEENPRLKVTYLIGNHDGGTASDESEHMLMLERLRERYSKDGYERFSYADHYQNSNLFVMHGHSHIEYDIDHGTKGGIFNHHYNIYNKNIYKETDLSDFLPMERISANDGKNMGRSLAKRMAKAIAMTDVVKDFIQSLLVPETTGQDATGHKEVYVAFGHRHRGFNETITRGDFKDYELEKDPHEELRNVTLHVTDLGYTKSPNFQIYHFDKGEVSRRETINLRTISKLTNGPGDNPAIHR